ncbi:MAG: hypothetical protein HOW97_28225 [Catenulispora sp.]|nr:hypothetical protein [Catenulispora sp.]
MRSSHLRKSLAASAILATSVASAAGFLQSAAASTAGASNSPLTVTDGTRNVVLNGHAVQYAGNIDRGSWAPDGSRIAYVRADGAVITERAGGGGAVVVVPAKAGVVRSHPTWAERGTAIVFAERTGTSSKLMQAPAFTADGGTPQESEVVSLVGAGGTAVAAGTEVAPDSNGSLIAFQHQDAGTGHQQIWVQDYYGRGSDGSHLAADDGTDPTLSPDGKTVAFLRTDSAGNKQIWSVPYDATDYNHPLGTAVQLTHDAHDHVNPTFSPDGTRIAYENGPGNGAAPTDVQSIAKDGSGQHQEWSHPGVPAYQGQNQDSVTRLAGADRIGTAIAASQAMFKSPAANDDGANAVVLSRSDQFADALGGSALATAKYGPLLLTPTDHLDPAVKAEIARVLGPVRADKTVYVLGGEQALSPAVFNAVKAMGYTVTRLAGADRYETSVAIARQTADRGVPGENGAHPERVLVATGDNFPDALSAGAAANTFNGNTPAAGVVILSDDKKLPPSTAAYLAEVKSHDAPGYTTPVYGVGGQADTALTNAGIKHIPVAGSDRYQTSYLVAKTFFNGTEDGGAPPTRVGFATALNWPDALSGGAFMGHQRGPLLLVDPVGGEPAKDAESWLLGWSGSISGAYVFGGTKAVPPITVEGVGGLIAGPAGADTVTNPKA